MDYSVKRADDPHAELYHHGTKGQKWGQRLYQNKDGSLTPLGKMRYGSDGDNSGGKKTTAKVSRKVRKQRAAALEKARQARAEKLAKEKADAETRERLLKSTDAKEIYENRHLLSYAELNDRVNRIDLENRLSGKIVQDNSKTGVDYVNDKMRKTSETLNNATNLYKKVDDAYSTVANSAIGKTLAKKLGLEPPKEEFNLADFWKNRNKKSTQEIVDVNKRLIAEEAIERKVKAREEASKAEQQRKEARKQVDDYVKNGAKDDKVTPNDSTYNKKGDDISDNKTATGKGNPNRLRLDVPVERFEGTGDDIIGNGTSKFTGWNQAPTRDAVYDGQKWVDELFMLEDKSGR